MATPSPPVPPPPSSPPASRPTSRHGNLIVAIAVVGAIGGLTLLVGGFAFAVRAGLIGPPMEFRYEPPPETPGAVPDAAPAPDPQPAPTPDPLPEPAPPPPPTAFVERPADTGDTAPAETRPRAPRAEPPGRGPGDEAEATPPPPPRTALRVGGSIPAPTKLRHVAPVYPQIAISARVQGVVIIEATIDQEGRIGDARVLRSIPLLDQAALDAVRQWEYEPTRLNGEPVPVIMTVTVNFTLQ